MITSPVHPGQRMAGFGRELSRTEQIAASTQFTLGQWDERSSHHIHIDRLLERERDRAGDRIRRQGFVSSPIGGSPLNSIGAFGRRTRGRSGGGSGLRGGLRSGGA